MRIVAAALALFLATTLNAQVVDPNELAYGPFQPGPRDHSFAIGVAPHGMLLAWSEIDPGSDRALIHAGLLDLDGRLVSPIRTLVPFNAAGHSTTPVIATDGNHFFVVWLELDPSTWAPSRVSGALVDPMGVQSGDTVNFGRAAAGPPSLVWDGLTYRVYGLTSYYVTPDGLPIKVAGDAVRQRVSFANPDANGWVDWFSGRRPCLFGRCSGGLVYRIEWAVVSANWIRTGWFWDEGYESGKPSVLANGDDLLVVWGDKRGLIGLPVVDGIAERPIRLQHPLLRDVTDIAAAESLVVFESAGNIYGSVIEDGGAKFGEPFAITSGERWETLPRVYLAGPNRYLVTYAIERDPAGATLAGRFVTIE